jgi:beta-glucanase (GH16 family)
MKYFLSLMIVLLSFSACASVGAPTEPLQTETPETPEIVIEEEAPVVQTAAAITKRPLTYPTVNTINAPVAGNFPDSLLRYVNIRNSRSKNFMQTIDWSPEVPRVFETDTEYTAILTLIPVGNNYSFAAMQLEQILGLPEENVTDITMEIEEDNMIINIAFEKTDYEYAEPKILFFDDFEGDELDTEKWAYCPNWDRQGRSTWDDSLVTVSDGYLRLGFVRDKELGHKKTEKQADADNWIRAGAVRTMKRDHINPLFENGYGYYEARLLLPKVDGMWGAFWLMSPTLKDRVKPEIGTEIDIVESIHNERGIYNAAIHWGGYGNHHQGRGSKSNPVDIYDGEFHIFALEWTPSEYIFYVDGIEFWRVEGNINRNPNYVKLSVESADWSVALPVDFTEGEMLVDYVKVMNQPKLISE